MKLVLAEMPSVAQFLAKVLGANKRCDGYLEGNGYVVSWCAQVDRQNILNNENAVTEIQNQTGFQGITTEWLR